MFARDLSLSLLPSHPSRLERHAQVQVSRTSDYTVTWGGSSFSGAGALYGGSQAYDATAFSNAVFNFNPVSNATDLMFNEGGGITISSPPLTPPPPYAAAIPVTFSGDGTLGYWGWTENSAGTNSGPVLTNGSLGGLSTLTFTGGGNESGLSNPPFDFYANVFLPGNWTTEGTSTGDYTNISWNTDFSTPTFTYDSVTNTTTVSTVDLSYDPAAGSGPQLTFTLIGSSAVPEPSIWALMLVGFAGLGFVRFPALRSLRRMAG